MPVRIANGWCVDATTTVIKLAERVLGFAYGVASEFIQGDGFRIVESLPLSAEAPSKARPVTPQLRALSLKAHAPG